MESDHAALKRLRGPRQSFRPLRAEKATIMTVEMILPAKHGHILHKQPGVRGDIRFVRNLLGGVPERRTRQAGSADTEQCDSP